MKKAIPVIAVLLFLAVTLGAYIPSRYYVSGIFTYWSKSDTSLAVNVDTANAIVRAYIKRLADSVASLRSSKDYEQFSGTFNSLNNANDSVNVALYGGVYHTHPNVWSQYLDRAMVVTDKPGFHGPSTWDNTLPPVSPDSAFIFRISRNASRPANARIWLTAYKVAVGSGLSFTNTAGVFYDAIIFDEANFKAVGTGNTQGHIQFVNERLR